jgi:hypothetical protein
MPISNLKTHGFIGMARNHLQSKDTERNCAINLQSEGIQLKQ